MSENNFGGFPPRPNLTGYTAVPNIFFDEVLPNINNMSELKILLAVFRKTYGWVKEIDQSTGQPIYKLEDEISYSQFEQLTGLSSTSIATGLTRAQNDGYLEKVQQGNYSGVTSAYRVVTSDSIPQKPRVQPTPPTPSQPKQQEPEKPSVQYLHVTDEDVPVPRQIGTPLANFTSTGLQKEVEESYQPALTPEKEDLLGEIFGSATTSTPEPKKKEKQKTPHQEFITNWFRCYYSTLNVSYGTPTGKEHGHIKGLLKDYDISTLVKAMEFYFKHYKEIEGVPADYPSITVFYAWRKKIIPASQHGLIKGSKKPSHNAREFDEVKFKEDDFFDN